jgi:hypothetical protein
MWPGATGAGVRLGGAGAVPIAPRGRARGQGVGVVRFAAIGGNPRPPGGVQPRGQARAAGVHPAARAGPRAARHGARRGGV